MSTDALFDVSREVVIITGVAGQLGSEYAKAFLRRGARVAGLDIRPSAPSKALSQQYPDDYLFLHSNITDKASLQNDLTDIETLLSGCSVNHRRNC